MANKLKKLEWGETPWDTLSRDELLREVQRMHAALGSAQSVLNQCRFRQTNPFWAEGGIGYRSVAMVKQSMAFVSENFDSESVYRSFFRYSTDLLFDGLGFGWDVCPKCGQMVGESGDGKRHYGMACKDVMNVGECDGVLRSLQWSDLAPKPSAPTGSDK